jgi:hypothetical protein
LLLALRVIATLLLLLEVGYKLAEYLDESELRVGQSLHVVLDYTLLSLCVLFSLSLLLRCNLLTLFLPILRVVEVDLLPDNILVDLGLLEVSLAERRNV